jgi:acyl transferase domain-containing protein
MDPQQRLLLEVAYEAIEDAGQVLDRLAAGSTGVFIGISSMDFSGIQASIEDVGSIDTYMNTGGALSLAANRISYCFDLKGPSLAVDTACSSSLVALHLACHSMWRKETSCALVGGVNVLISPTTFIGFSRLSMLSPGGRCKAFDASADGYVRGEGVGVVVLKPLSAALAEGDRIYALIRGTAVNQDGHTSAIVVPSEEAQMEMVRQACRQAGISPSQVQYVEAHGTGTIVGDRIEAHARKSTGGRPRGGGGTRVPHRLGEDEYRPPGAGCGNRRIDQGGLGGPSRHDPAESALSRSQPQY